MEPFAVASFVDWSLFVLDRYWLAACGAGVLAVFAAHHFNSPDYVLSKRAGGDSESIRSNPRQAALARTKIEAPPIFTTQRERYRRSQVKYIAALEVIFIFYVVFPEIFSSIGDVTQVEIVVPEALNDRVIYGLFGLMGLYATFPGLNRLDRRIREKLHRKAIIPEVVTLMAERISESDYKPPREIEEAVIEHLSGVVPSVDFEKTGDSLKQEWFRLSCVRTQLKQMLSRDELSALNRFLSPDAEDIDREYSIRQQQLVELIAKENQIEPPAGKPIRVGKEEEDLEELGTLEAEFLLNIRKNLRFKISVLYYRICILHSMIFVALEKTTSRIERRFHEIGYDVEVIPIPRIDWESIIKTLLTISIVIFVPSVVYVFTKSQLDIVTPGGFEGTVPETMDQTLLWSLNILILHVLCIFVAMWTKRLLARRRARLEQGQPAHRRSIIVENALVLVLCYGVTYLLGVLLFYSDHGLRVFRLGIPWAAVPAITGCFVGFYIDRIMAGADIGWWRKYSQGLLTCLFAAIASFLFTPPQPLVDDIPAAIWLYVVYISGMQLLVGLGVGWIFPNSYRKQMADAEKLLEEEAAASPASLVTQS